MSLHHSHPRHAPPRISIDNGSRFLRSRRTPLNIAIQGVCIGFALGAASLPVQAQNAQPGAAATSVQASGQAFNIPAGPLGEALNSLARSAGINLSYDSALIGTARTRGLQGSYPVQSALDALLSGTGLEAVARGSNAYSIRRVQVLQRSSDGTTQLPEVAVTASAVSGAEVLPQTYAGGQVAKGARLGLLGNVDIMDAPFNVTAYTAATIENQQSTSLEGVVRNDPSVRFSTSDGLNADNFTIRGFDLVSTDISFNGMYGLLPGGHVPTEFAERVEVFKGPAAMLFGISPYGAVGGAINVVPKRADDAPLTRLTASFESDSKFGLAADVSRRFGDEKRLGIRVNGSYANGKTGVEDQKKLRRFGSLGLDYQGDRWRLEMDAYSTDQNQSNGSSLHVGFSTLGHIIAPPDADTNALRGIYVNQDTEGLVFRGALDINDQWSAYAALGGSRYRYKGYLNGTRVVVLNDAGDATGQTYHQAGYYNRVTAETGLRGNFSTGAIGHQVVLSVSALKWRSGLADVTQSTSASYTTNIYHPIYPLFPGDTTPVNKTADNAFTSVGLIDTLSFADERVLLTLGARAQRVRNKSWNARTLAQTADYDETAITPVLGLVVKPWGEGVSLYGNYIEGLSAGQYVGTAYSNAGETLEPYTTEQMELGVKWDAGSFTNTLSLFQITKPGAISVSTAGATLPALQVDGEQRHRGVEWNIFGQVAPQARMLGGVAYTRGKQVRASTAANDGKSVAGVPKWTANLGAEWDLPWISGLTLDGRITYTGAQYLDPANRLRIPSWKRYDVGMRYATRMAGKPVVLRGNVENLTDNNYWSGRFNDGIATLGAPRTFKLSASVDF